jgi:hypothetical protein
MTLLLACGGGNDSFSASAIVDDLTDRLRQENTQHYAFGCVDFDGTVLSSEPSPETIASDANIELEHTANAWVSETGGVVLGGDGGQQYIVIHDPASEATNAQTFGQREATVGDGKLFCLVPE